MNVNSLVSKVLYVKHFITMFSLSIVAVCETLLIPSVSSSFVAIDGFQVVRGDGSNITRKHGCCLYAAHFLSFASVDVGLLNVAVVFLTALDIYIVVVYRPPSNTALQYEHLLSILSDFCLGREVILLEDVNLPSLD